MPVKLQPIAAPTDPFISAPGIVGPVQTQFDFNSLRGLSQSLDSALNNAAEIERKRVERESIPANESLLEKLSKDQYRVLDTADPTTTEGLKQLQSLGIKDADNGYAIASLRKAAGVYQVQQAGYAEYMRDSQWVSQAAQEVLYNNVSAQDAVRARSQEFIKNLGGMTSEYAKVAAANYISLENTKVVSEVLAQKDKRFQEDTARATLTALQPVVDSVVQQWAGNDSPEYRAATTAAFKGYVEQQTKLLGSAERAETVVTQAIETAALQLARSDGDAAHHALDGIEDAIGTPTMLPKLEDIRNKVDREIRSSMDRGDKERARSKATFALNEALAKTPVRGAEALRDWLWKGEGRQILDQVARETGVEPYLLAETQEGVYRFWASQQDAAQSDPEAITELQKMARSGNVDQAEALLATYGLDKVTYRDRPSLYSLFNSERQRGSNSPEAKQEMQAGYQSSVEALGKLPGEASPLANSARQEYEQAYKSHLDQHPNDYTGASLAASKAMYASPQWAEIKSLREQGTLRYFKSTPDFKDAWQMVNNLKVAAKAQLVEDAKLSDGPPDLEQYERNWARIEANVERDVDALHKSLSEDESIKSLPTQADRIYAISSRIKQEIPNLIDKARGNLPNLTPEKPVLAVTTDTQLQNFETLGDISKFVPDKEKIVKNSAANDGWGGDAYSLAVGMDDETISSFAQGGVGGYGRLLSYPLAKDALELALSARLVDGNIPANADAAGKNAAGIIALKLQSSETAKGLLKMRLVARGLMPEEIIAGKTRAGVSLQDVFSDGRKPWYTAFPLQQVAIYHSTQELDEAVKLMKEDPQKSQLAQVLLALRIDPEDSKAVNKFVEWQTKLANQRVGAEYGYELGAGSVEERQAKMREASRRQITIEPTDLPWLKKRKQEWINFMEKSNAK